MTTDTMGELHKNPPLDGMGLLAGAGVLAVEDEFLLLLELETVLLEAGARKVRSCRTIEQALAAADSEDFDVGVLDIRLGDDTVAPVARKLMQRGIPFVFYTGQIADNSELAGWTQIPVVAKPAAPAAIVQAVAESIRQRASRSSDQSASPRR
jgi:DNA-binding NtrC family response regulator